MVHNSESRKSGCLGYTHTHIHTDEKEAILVKE